MKNLIKKSSQVESLYNHKVTEEEVDAIEIPKNATNGDMIEKMFPNCEQKEHMNNGYFEMYFDNDLKNASYMRVSKDWWNAPYKRGGEE